MEQLNGDGTVAVLDIVIVNNAIIEGPDETCAIVVVSFRPSRHALVTDALPCRDPTSHSSPPSFPHLVYNVLAGGGFAVRRPGLAFTL